MPIDTPEHDGAQRTPAPLLTTPPLVTERYTFDARDWASTDEMLNDMYAVERPDPSGRPWLMANMVMGIDGSVTRHGRAGDLSDHLDQQLFSFLRTQVDLVLVGASTVRIEHYGPLDASHTSARLGIVTIRGDLDFESPLFTASCNPPVIFTSARSLRTIESASRGRAEVVAVGDDVVDFGALAALLHRLGIRRVLSEGGPTVLSALASCSLLDELCLTVVPIVGDGERHLLATGPAGSQFSLVHCIRHQSRLFTRYLSVAGRAEVSG